MDKDDPIAIQHLSVKAQFEKAKESLGHLEAMRGEFDKLLILGDEVSPDDVVKAAAELVGKGFTPEELATVLADMPTQSPSALNQWVIHWDQQITQWEQKAEVVMEELRHKLGVAAMHVVMDGHMENQSGPLPAPGPMAPAAAPQPGLSISSPTMGNA